MALGLLLSNPVIVQAKRGKGFVCQHPSKAALGDSMKETHSLGQSLRRRSYLVVAYHMPEHGSSA
jgi:hypothetical protein